MLIYLQKSTHAGSTSVAESLYKNKSSLETIFKILDKDNSGYISLDEFSEACELLNQHFPHETHEDLMEMCRMMDINKDGLVDLNEFLEAFRLCESASETLGTFSAALEAPRRESKLLKKASVEQQKVQQNDEKTNNGNVLNGAPKAKAEESDDTDEDNDDDEDDDDAKENNVKQVNANGNANNTKVPRNNCGKKTVTLSLAIDADGKLLENNTNIVDEA